MAILGTVGAPPRSNSPTCALSVANGSIPLGYFADPAPDKVASLAQLSAVGDLVATGPGWGGHLVATDPGWGGQLVATSARRKVGPLECSKLGAAFRANDGRNRFKPSV